MDLKNSTQKVWSGECHRNPTANLVVKKEGHYYLARLHLQISPNLFPDGSSVQVLVASVPPERDIQSHTTKCHQLLRKQNTPTQNTLPLDKLPLYCLSQRAEDKTDSEETNK